ncbi:DUF3429 domain-containing protein [Sphingomonas aquatilis]|uniref:DUF3429 domain-containing protein n=1 Tax=Sphingomonas aquatilis TaxID=93063 RepID=A0AAW3TMT2_9SPHN|nr:DUF3429 domain-containing protein [Sphingomonas aquatilis]MBB3873872.1 hypothetical protein [Sphingomonas aquatilis]MCI4652946.1 DUF3429 domain-containing protein [Sphingomonas aquatilis]GEM73780.1 hypothetical protein SAQ01S_35460 [Sphingomonas aquatilis NBRC 16722]
MPERHSASAEPIGSDASGQGLTGTVGESAMILGYAGLLPQIAAAATCAFDQTTQTGGMFAFGYAALILSFLGGIWWGFAMCAGVRQGEIACLAVAPSIVAAGLILLSVGGVISLALALVLLGVAVLLTLLVDRRLTAQGITPGGWMALRVPLSLGLGSLSIIIGALCGVLAA